MVYTLPSDDLWKAREESHISNSGMGADGTFSGRWDRKNSMRKAWRNKTPVFPGSVAQSKSTALKRLERGAVGMIMRQG